MGLRSLQGDGPTRSIYCTWGRGGINGPLSSSLTHHDAVLFYVNSKVLLEASRTIFQEFLGASLEDKRFRDTIIDVPESSSVLNIIIHASYKLSCAKHSPPFDDLEAALNRMPVYGLVPKSHIVPPGPLYDILLSFAPMHPIRLYALAGHFGLQELALNTSSYLLSYDLSELTDDLAKRIGPTYLKRLMCFHLNIIESLKAIILQPPHPHPATPACDFVEQKKLGRAWALTASYLAWDSRPDLSVHRMQTTFLALEDHLTCDQCKAVLKSRVREVVVKWVNVKVRT
ncbi:hypothetical protein GALMADRAFT_902424 [Galerina marginata CBS 339.88]|uniref:Uncharacterized protein n=1 Tax=Galerina marginata (strain CBS 339.88) TaxID=685588 RepID=A0A067SGL6_GALM3|nr:hypothetical protein GALMADRAFT_902424 [Galerina marginata CBS 339.88]